MTRSGTAQVTRRRTNGGREWNSALARRLAVAPPLPRPARLDAIEVPFPERGAPHVVKPKAESEADPLAADGG